VKEAKENLTLLEAQLNRKRFFGGDTPGYLDIAACALGLWLSVLEEVTGVTLVDDNEFSALCQWAKEYKSNETLKLCMPDKDQVVAYFTENKERYKMWAKTTLGQ
jgi:glutathione S-transferase